MNRIAFIYFSFSSFVKQDYEMLSKHFDVNLVQYTCIADAIKIINAVRKSDISYSWFADGWAFFAVLASKMFRKKSIVVVGGYDVADEPTIQYGMGTKNILRRWMSKYVLNNANTLLPVSEFTKTECFKFLSRPRDFTTVYNCVNTDKFVPSMGTREIILSVGSKIKLKGLDTFVSAAWHMPNKTFVVVGMSEDSITDLERCCNIPDNLVMVGNVSYDDMAEYYQRAKVYCQLSCRESFGMALAEAMSCGCIPVVTDRGAMREVVGNDGIYVLFGDVDATVSGIEEAFVSTDLQPRDRIETNFNTSHREASLNGVITFNSKDSRTRNRIRKSVKMADVKSGERVLDLGCGDSAIKSILPSDVIYIGIDTNIGDIQCDLELGIPKELETTKFDVIFMNEFIEHIENFRSLLNQCRNMLLENGRIIISTPSSNRAMFGEDPTHIHCFRKSNIRNLAALCGMRIDKITGTYLGIPYIPIVPMSQTSLTGVVIYRLVNEGAS